MKNLMKKLFLIMMSANLVLSAYAEVIDTGSGKIDVGQPNIKYGTSSTYNSNGSTESNLKSLKKRAKELRKAKKDLFRKKRRAKGREAKKKIKEEIEKVSKELKKVFDDNDFERGLTTSSRKPKRSAEAKVWKRKQRHERVKKLKTKQTKWEEKQKKKREQARRVTELRDLGGVTIGDVVSANDDVMQSQRELDDIEDQAKEEECDVISDENIEVCMQINQARTEASATLEEASLNLETISSSLPPILLGGGIYVLYDRMNEMRESYKHLRSVQRELINCEKLCDVTQERISNIQDSILEQESLDKSSLDEAQDELRADEVNSPLNVELVIPKYLAEQNHIPFSTEKELPLIFAVAKDANETVIKSAYAVVNNNFIELTYYPEQGIFTGSYVGFKTREDFTGSVEVELFDGQVLSEKFSGKINTTKPKVRISSVPGTILRRGKFKISVSGEFDKIEIDGENVKKKTIKFDKIMKSYKLSIKALSKGAASISVTATRTSKNLEMQEFDGKVLATDELGRVVRDDDFFQPIELGNGKKNEVGYCCEEVGDLTCEGCIMGKRSRKSCKALNKLPGYNLKAFLSAKDLTCTKL